MKTKELIRQLQEADPSGELECAIGNSDIHFVEVQPAYWDGCLEVLERDESNPYYNIIGAKYTTEGVKINISTLSIEEAIFNDPDLPVEFDTHFLYEEHNDRYKKAVKRYRKEAKQIKEEAEKFKKEKDNAQKN